MPRARSLRESAARGLEIVRLYESGLSLKEAATAVGLSQSTAHHHITRHNVRRSKKEAAALFASRRAARSEVRKAARRSDLAKIRARFMSKVSPEPNSGCWLWTGPIPPGGRPSLNLFNHTRIAARLAVELFIGPIPLGLMACHKCDNPVCVNPDHLFLGSAKDNGHDMARKNRGTNSRAGLPYGVLVNRRDGTISAMVTIASQRHYLGVFDTIEAAGAAAARFKKSRRDARITTPTAAEAC